MRCPLCGAGKQNGLFASKLAQAKWNIIPRGAQPQLPWNANIPAPRVLRISVKGGIFESIGGTTFDLGGDFHLTMTGAEVSGSRAVFTQKAHGQFVFGKTPQSKTNNILENSTVIKIYDSNLNNIDTVFDLSKDSKWDIEISRTQITNVNTLLQERDAPGIVQCLGFPPDVAPIEVADMLRSIAGAGADPGMQEKAARDSSLGKRLTNYASISTVIQGAIALACSPILQNVLALLGS